jgi:microcystin degradation protein MlrC
MLSGRSWPISNCARAPTPRRLCKNWATGNSEVAGFVNQGARLDLDLVPTVYATANPKGAVTADAFEELTSRLIERLRGIENMDGMLLALHGAMYTDEFPHADEEIVRRVRATVGLELPLVVTHDFHANISPAIVEMSHVLITYQQNPHIDTKQRGAHAASILSRMLAGEVRPRQAIVKPPLIWNIVHQNTSREPLSPITAASIELERQNSLPTAGWQ